MHAAVIAINEAIDHKVATNTLHTLRLDAAHLINVDDKSADSYQQLLYQAKHTKAENARNKVIVTKCVCVLVDW